MKTTSLLITLALLAACKEDRKAPPAFTEDEQRARGQAAIGELKKTLVTRLTAALADGAPQAVAVRNTEAPAIAAKLSVDGVTVGRATRKPRNPSNAAAGWQADALAELEALVAAGKPLQGASVLRHLPDGRTGYAEPLVIQEMCITCHGSALAPDITAILAEKYPGDQATGYQVGDLRGIAWAELPERPIR